MLPSMVASSTPIATAAMTNHFLRVVGMGDGRLHLVLQRVALRGLLDDRATAVLGNQTKAVRIPGIRVSLLRDRAPSVSSGP